VRGFWGDIVNSPFIGFGVELDDTDEQNHFFQHNQINYIYDSQEVTEFNLNKQLFRIEKNELFDYMTKEKERKKRKEEEEEELKKEKELEDIKNGKLSTLTINEIDKENELIKENNKKVIINDSNEIFLTESSDNSLLSGFKKLNIKIHFLTGNLETISKKKKFNNIFDIILLGFNSKNIFDKLSVLGKKDMTLLVELNTFMTSFNDNEKQLYKDKLKSMAKDFNYFLDDSNSKYIWKFLYKEAYSSEKVNPPEGQLEILNAEDNS
jgi:hypothetical protein